ncbi:cell division protein FtsQ/DivIB [Blautia sp. Marseille-P3201T]|uniref:cell division protein FtsQ/DivIB n=1 Tax=Blautia sp. Marseille-P3201T TaxID=1907659 RepID=UPI000931771C|nr:FtsQ-type POTRA domain-containing protein [Blautia sp. Marseille-P3201T]
MSRRKLYRILIEGIVCAILIFALVFFVGFRVTKVEVKGNEFYTDKEIKKMVLDAPIAKNTILAMMIKTEEKTKDAQLIEKVTLKRENMNTLVVQVKEKKLIGYFDYEGKYANFDRQGVVQILTEEPIKDVPYIEGLDVKNVKQGEKLKGVNTKKLNTILSVGKMLEKTEQKPDKLVFNEMKQLVLYYGEIEVRLGSDENMDEKMNRLVGILPQLEGMEGILHLENITEDTQAVVFDDTQKSETDTSEEDGEETDPEETNPEETTEDTTEDTQEDPEADVKENTDENTDENQLEYSDGADAADTRSGKRE